MIQWKMALLQKEEIILEGAYLSLKVCFPPESQPPLFYLLDDEKPGTPFVSYFLGNWKPLKPATIALKIGHLAFQEHEKCWNS